MEMPQTAPDRAGPAEVARNVRPEPPVLGEGLFAGLERLVLPVERWTSRLLPEPLNPLAQTGAVAVLMFLVAAVSGVALLLWYSPSVVQAFRSIEAMHEQPLTAGLVRSLHRYSSDACMLFVLLHAARLLLARRFGGPRLLAWLTGALLLASLWLVGWLGYWLVWDERARQVALGTAKMMDLLPVFAAPLSRSFLTDQSVNSLLFFVVFFLHMLLPLALGIPLWLHISRLSRPRFLPGRALGLASLAALLLVSLLVPADLAAPARMTVEPGALSYDAFYLWPLALTDRLGGGLLWLCAAGALLLLVAPPLLLQRRRPAPAQVNTSSCNACTLCVEDCPFGAIRMVPRTDGRGFDAQAQVDPAKCVGCGICSGSCNPGAINVPILPVHDARRTLDAWLARRDPDGEVVVFLCASAPGAAIDLDAEGHSRELPGARVMKVPCTGWVHSLTIERAFRRGAAGVLVAGCGPIEPPYREGLKWAAQRAEGRRAPFLRAEKTPTEQVARVNGGSLSELAQAIAGLHRGAAVRAAPPRRMAIAFGSAALAALLLAPMVFASRAPSRAVAPGAPMLVVSFKHPGEASQRCRKRTDEELAGLPPHMRQPEVCERGRSAVRRRVRVDGEVVHEQSYAPAGLARDGTSIALERLAVAPGRHEVEVALEDREDAEGWRYLESRELGFVPGSSNVVLFDRASGFAWHGGEETVARPSQSPGEAAP